VDHLQYLLLMAACVALTLPLELVLGARVWRQPRRLALTLAPVVALFVVWDVVAIARDHWHYAARYVTGVTLPGALPIEELVFFVVIPICGLLTLEAVRNLLGEHRP
jgi:lycopene cyclase domain-containing protein